MITQQQLVEILKRTKDMNNEMTDEKRELIKTLLKWYWEIAEPRKLISKSDYEFIYDIWNNGLNYYGSDVQTRLNRIRNTYINNK